MADLIYRQVAFDEIASLRITINGMREGKTILKEALTAYRTAVLAEIEAAPAVDAVEVVRCKDCGHMEIEESNGGRYCHVWGFYNGMGDEGFCNYGERREDDG